jgi:tetratricopeptide (TPR) repeat protein
VAPRGGLFARHSPRTVETQGSADAAHDWPAQKLLDYGNSVLGSLRPGMVYMGGTDPGRFIPTLLNETSEGERHIVLTQNALTDFTYLDYVSFLHGDRMKTLTKDDNQRAFQEYLADAQKRFDHDQQFPTEPKQVRPGEDLRFTEGRFQASGQVSVVAVREKLFQLFMQNNPGVAFAMEESFPFKSTYATATPLGPIMELGAADGPSALTAQRASQSVDYWRGVAQQLQAEPDGSDPRKAYSKMISAQAGLLLARDYPAEAGQAFRIANAICPTLPETLYRYVSLLVDQKRFAEAVEIGQNAVNAAPDDAQFRALLGELKKMNAK